MAEASYTPPIESPEWYLLRLLRALQDRQLTIGRWDRYYDGDQPLAFASQKFRDAFGERFPAFTSNFCATVVDAVAERLEVQGFRFGGRGPDQQAWDIWQANDLDASSQQAQQEALIKGYSYALVEPSGEGYPTITIEDATEAIVEHDPRSLKRRRAALKRWVDDEGYLVVFLYLPEAVYKYRTKQKWTPEFSAWWSTAGPWDEGYVWRIWSAAQFAPMEVPGEEWPLPNRLGRVPLVELANRPRLRKGGQSEIAPIRSNQDAINKYRCDALITSEFAAYPQRYLLNYEPEQDDETGRAKEPFRAAIDRLWVVPPPDPDQPNPPELKIGQLDSASLEPYARMIELEVAHLSANSDVPFYRLLGGPQSVPPSAESIKSGESGLVRKLARAELFFGEGWEEVIRLGFLAQGNRQAAGYDLAETVWVDSETRNEAVRTDAVVKLHGAGIIDDELAWEMAGLTRQQITALRERREEAAKAAEAAGEGEGAGAPGLANGAGGAPELAPAPMGPRMGGARAPIVAGMATA